MPCVNEYSEQGVRKQKICPMYFKICPTYFKISRTYFLPRENPFENRGKNADKFRPANVKFAEYEYFSGKTGFSCSWQSRLSAFKTVQNSM